MTGPYKFMKYTDHACNYRNELPTRTNFNLEQAKTFCRSDPTCVSFERMPTAGKFQFSSSCTLAQSHYDAHHTDLYVIHRSTTPVPPQKFYLYNGKACAGRNELGTKTNFNLEQAKEYCRSVPTCVSFERTSTAGAFRFSTSCTKKEMASYSSTDLYVIYRSTIEE